MKPKFKIHYLQFLLLLLLYLLGVLIRFHNTPNESFYVSDSAMRYRYARMIGEGETVPHIDYKIQHPEGLEVRTLILLLEDKVVGYLYRPFAHLLSFDRFLQGFIAFFSSLTIIPVFFMGKSLWRSPLAGLMAAAFYTISFPSFDRTLGNYLREEFTLPFLFLFLFFFFHGLRDERGEFKIRHSSFTIHYSILSGFSLFIALSSWHLAQFFFLLFVLFIALSFFFGRGERMIPPFGVVVAFAFLAGVVNQPLRHKFFLVSYSMIIAYSLLLSAFFHQWINRIDRIEFIGIAVKKILIFGGILLLFLGVTFPLTRHLTEYSHVYGLILSKIRFLGIKPENPSLLPFDARALWLGPFNSPDLYTFSLTFALPFLIAFLPFVILMRRWWRGETSFGEEGLLYYATVFLPLYFMVQRLSVFLIFFLALLVGYWGKGREGSKFPSGDRNDVNIRNFALRISFLPLLFIFQFHTAWNYKGGTPFTRFLKPLHHPPDRPFVQHDTDRWEIFNWIKKETKPEAAILARFPVSPMVTAYGERSTLLVPIFESKESRDRIKLFTEAFFQEEEVLYNLCKRFRCDYVLYGAYILLDGSKDFDRYLANQLQVKKKSVAYKMHFFPETLRHFTLQYQTEYHRLFEVRIGEEDIPQSAIRTPHYRYSPQFDPDLFLLRRDDTFGHFDDEKAHLIIEGIAAALITSNEGVALLEAGRIQEAIVQIEKARDFLPRSIEIRNLLANAFIQAGEHERAVREVQKVLEMVPEESQAHFILGDVYSALGRNEDAMNAYLEVLRLQMDHVDTHYRIGSLYQRMGQTWDAIRFYEQALTLDPDRDEIQNDLGILYTQEGFFNRAKNSFEKALGINPKNFKVYGNLGTLYFQSGDRERAIQMLEKAHEINPDNEVIQRFLQRLRESSE